MNRKLHNTLIAFSASGLMLVAGLLAAGPATRTEGAAAGPVVATVPAPAPVDTLARTVDLAVERAADAAVAQHDLEAGIEARANAFEARMDRNADADVGETFASAIAFAAEISTEAALVAAFQNRTGDEDDGRADEERRRQRHARQIRGAMAVPYFSFAQGLRRGAGS